MSEEWNTRTKLVHSGTKRSQWNEVSEAIFLTQGFVYASLAKSHCESSFNENRHGVCITTLPGAMRQTRNAVPASEKGGVIRIDGAKTQHWSTK